MSSEFQLDTMWSSQPSTQGFTLGYDSWDISNNYLPDANFQSSFGDNAFQFDAMDSDLASFDPNASSWGMSDTIGTIQGVGAAIEMIGAMEADNQDAAAHRKQAELDRDRAAEITRRAAISMEQVSTASRAIVSSQQTALVGRGVSASGNQAAMAASDSINEAIKEQANIDKAAIYDRDMALAAAKSHEDQASNLDSSESGTIFAIITGVGVGVSTGNPLAGITAAKGTKALLG